MLTTSRCSDDFASAKVEIERDWASDKIINLYEQDYRLAGFHDTKNMLFWLYPKYRERILKVIKKC